MGDPARGHPCPSVIIHIQAVDARTRRARSVARPQCVVPCALPPSLCCAMLIIVAGRRWRCGKSLPSNDTNCRCPRDRKDLTPSFGCRGQAEERGRRRITCERGWGREDQCDRHAQDRPTCVRERRAPDEQNQRAGNYTEHYAAERTGSSLFCMEADEGADKKRQCI